MMSTTRSISQLLLILLFALTPTLAKPQPPPGIWIEIHVNGPWQYAPYAPSALGYDQIVLIVPRTKGHKQPVFLSGPNAAQKEGARDTHISSETLHTLSIDGIQNGKNCPAGSPQSTSRPFIYTGPLDPARADSVIRGTAKDSTGRALKRYAIVLPKPCYTTANKRGDSSSKMAIQQISTELATTYTAWMTLHYFVTSASVNATYDKIQANFSDEVGVSPALSFVMRGKDHMNEDLCDWQSLMSVSSAAILWGIKGHLYAQFPTLVNKRQTGDYSTDPLCKFTASGDIQNPPDFTKSAGSGDCHGGHIVIKSALP